MALPATITFANFVVELETAVGPPAVWMAPCGFDTKSLTMTASSSDATVPDCTNPEAPAWTVRGVTALAGQIQGSGVMATEDQALWDAWFDSGLTKMIRIRLPGVGFRVGLGILTSLGDSVALKSDGNLVKRSVTIDSAGAWPWTAGNPPA